MDDSVALINALRGISGDNNDGLGGSGIWILLLFIILGGWGSGFNRNYGGGTAGVGGNELYPWINQSEQISNGFRDQMLNTGINGIQGSVTNGFAGVQQALCAGFGGVNMGIANGFAQAEIAANSRQMADMNQMFGMQTAMMQGFNAQQSQTAQCCCDQQLAMAQQTATLLAEHCQDRATSTANTQRILDKLCDLELQGVKQQLDDERRANVALQNQLNMANFAASQTAQTAQLLADNFAQTSALEQYLAPVPRPAYIVQNPNYCGQTGCGRMAA